MNVVGFFKAEFGHGEAARRIVAGIERAGIPFSTITMRAPHHRERHAFDERSSAEVYGTNVVCLNPEHILEFAEAGGRDLLASRYTIGAWCWEGSRFPPSLHGAFRLVDEIWVASEFVAGLISAETDKPVLRFPMPVEVPPAAEALAERCRPPGRPLRLPLRLRLLQHARAEEPARPDRSVQARFSAGLGPILVLKSINGRKKRQELARVQEAAATHPDIRVVDEFVAAEHVQALTALCDCYVSLHRSEGFGLTIADAMAYGKPAVATRYSGNLTFMDDENSYLVGAGLATVPPGIPNYPAGSVWADPNLEEAAALMREVVENPDETAARAARGRQTIGHEHSVDRMAEFAGQRLSEVAELETDRASAETPAELAEQFLIRGPSVPWDVPSARLGPLGVYAPQVSPPVPAPVPAPAARMGVGGGRRPPAKRGDRGASGTTCQREAP